MVTKYQIFSAFFSDIYEKVFYLHLLVFYSFFLCSRARKQSLLCIVLIGFQLFSIYFFCVVNTNSLIIYNNMQQRLIVDFFIFSDMKPPRVTTAPKVIWKSGGSKTPSRIHYFTRQTMGKKAKFKVKIQFLYS